jgi:hypothetical protein
MAAPAAAQHGNHGPAAPAPASAAPQTIFLAAHEFSTLRILCDMILPADEVSPAASATGAPEYIDSLCRGNVRIARIYHGGLAWLDAVTSKLHGVPFGEAAAGQRTAILEKLAYKDRTPPEWRAGAEFFEWVRKMTLDGYYTSQAGYKDLGYAGGKGMTVYQVPEAALRQALSRWKP